MYIVLSPNRNFDHCACVETTIVEGVGDPSPLHMNPVAEDVDEHQQQEHEGVRVVIPVQPGEHHQ